MEKILIVTRNPLDKGGIQNVIMNTVRSLRGEYIFDMLIQSSQKGYYDEEFLSFGGSIFRNEFRMGGKPVSNRIGFYLRGDFIYKSVKEIIKNHGPYRAVHCHIAEEAGLALLAAKHCGVPVRAAHTHVAFDSSYNLIAKAYVGFLRKLLYRNATAMIACSKIAGEKLFGNYPYHIIYNTCDRRFFENSLPREPHDAPMLLQVAMICDNKNQLFSVSVFKELRKAYPSSRLVFIGAAKDTQMEQYLSGLKDQIKKESLEDAVEFLPADADVKAEMEKADYLLFPSRREGLGITPLEAQALGMKCFVSTGVPDEVDCGGCIFMNLSDGAAAWARRIAEQFEADHGARERYDMRRFSPDVIMEQYRKLYQGELN